MKIKKGVIIPILVVLILLGGVVAYLGINIVKYKNTLETLKIEDVDLSKVPDGTYKGSCDMLMVKAEVAVAVKDHKITEIKLTRHENGKGQAAEVLPDKVVEAQSLKVDVISGATASSKTILKAIENALNAGIAK